MEFNWNHRGRSSQYCWRRCWSQREVNKLKFQIQKQLMESKTTELEAQAKIVLAEAHGFNLIGYRC